MRNTFLVGFLAFADPGLHAQSVANQGLAVHAGPVAFAQGDLVAFAALEADQGADLDGDGTIDDSVVHVHRVSTGVTTNTGASVPTTLNDLPIVLGDRLCAIPVLESQVGAGGTDRNGDGDVLDVVLAVHDAQTGITTNLRLALDAVVFPPSFGVSTRGPHLLFGAWETAQGADLNGDGDMNDVVLHRWSPGDAAATSLGSALRLSPIVLGPRHALFLVNEWNHAADLNGDGDILDGVVHALSLASGLVTNLGWAADRILGDGDLFAFSVIEADQGATDLDGDGSANDTVLRAFLAPSGTVRPLVPSLAPMPSGMFTVKGYVIAWSSKESETGAGSDWNGDGDTADAVLFTHHARGALTRNAGVAIPPLTFFGVQFVVADDHVVTRVSEAAQHWADRNGDGDVIDGVAYLFDARTGFGRNLGFAALAPSPAAISAEVVAFSVVEAEQAQDLNGDGHMDVVVLAHRFVTGGTAILSRTITRVLDLSVCGANVVYPAAESVVGSTGTDLNGDGDTFDEVMLSWNCRSEIETSLGVAFASGYMLRTATSSTAVAFAASEFAQGVNDLNGDGDVLDGVLHVARF